MIIISCLRKSGKCSTRDRQNMVSDTRDAMNGAGLVAMADPEDIFHHVGREWNAEAGELTECEGTRIVFAGCVLWPVSCLYG